MKRLGLALVLAAALSASPVHAYYTDDHTTGFSLSYVVSIPTADFSDRMGSTSWRGLGIEYTSLITPTMAWAFSVRWQYFNENIDGATFTTSSGATLTGNQFKAVDAVPIMLHYKFFLTPDQTRTFVGLGVGAIYAGQLNSIGTFSFNKYGWQFALAPEAGVIYQPKASSGGVLASARYDAGFGADAAPSITALTFQLGLFTGF